jgi:hypothetical protein
VQRPTYNSGLATSPPILIIFTSASRRLNKRPAGRTPSRRTLGASGGLTIRQEIGRQMKQKITIGITVLLTLVLLSTFMYSFLHKISVKDHPRQSDSRYNSKLNKFYIADYIPNKAHIELKLRKGTVDLDTAWVEFPWYFEPNHFVTTKERLNENKWYNLCIKIKTRHSFNDLDDFVWNFEFRNKTIGAIGGFDLVNHQQASSLFSIPDTLYILFEEKNLSPGIGWKKPIVTDTIIYYKKIDGN